MRLPSAEAHHAWHPTGREVALAQQVHPAIIEKAHEIVFDGTADPLEVKDHLKYYVQHSICPEQPPDTLDRVPRHK